MATNNNIDHDDENDDDDDDDDDDNMRVEWVKSDIFGGESFQERAKKSARDATPNEPVPRLIRTLVCDTPYSQMADTREKTGA